MDKFKDIADDALKAAYDEKLAALQELLKLENPEPAQVTEAQALAADVREHKAEIQERTVAAAEAADEFAKLKDEDFDIAEVEAVEPEPEAVEPEAVEPEVEAVEPIVEPVAAAKTSTKAKVKTVAQLAGKTARPAAPEAEEGHKTTLSLVAAMDSGMNPGSVLDITGISQGMINRLKGMAPPNGDGTTEDIRKLPVATLHVEFPPELVIDRRSSDETQLEIIDRAADESRLEGNSLVAAGGWCAPSEILYDLSEDESLDGILSLPEVQVKRGGIRFTPGPQFADFYANAGFLQTETQAIAGTTKPCYTVTCPTFQEVRLDAVGLCIKVPILTNAAYPELVNRFTSGTLTAHEHWKNADIIARVAALSTSRVLTSGNFGSTVSDTLDRLGLVADERRQSQRLEFSRTMEVVVDFWMAEVFKNDLARRMGVGADAITDEMLNAHFRAKKLNVQWVYDWHALTGDAYPATFQAIIYPAGTFVKGVSDVINLGAVYDAASLAVNEYTGMFTEEGVLVAKRKLGSDIVTLPICSAGRVGAANFTCA